MMQFILNRDTVETDVRPGTVILDFLRGHRRLTGTKEGCREGDCGACMVLLGEGRNGGVHYRAVNSCLLPLGEAAGRHLVSIEGLNPAGLTPAQQAFVDEGAVQCGFCTPGFIVSLAGFLLSAPRLTTEAAADALAGNLCRCTGYASIRRALDSVCRRLQGLNEPRVPALIEQGWLPPYFAEIPERLRSLPPTARTAGAVPVAGGTDLFVQRADELAAANLELLSRRPDLQGIEIKDGQCAIGAATSWAELEDSAALQQVLPDLTGRFKLLASRPIRQRATVGGNLVNASPIGDLIILLLALDARVVFSGRTLPLRDFYLGYKQLNKPPGAVVEKVVFRLPPKGAVLNFEKVCRRAHLDIASVNTAMLAVLRDRRVEMMQLSAGGVAPIPLYLKRTSEALAGAPLTADTVWTALGTAQTEVSPISDVRGSARYKRLLLRQLLLAHFLRLAPGLAEELAL